MTKRKLDPLIIALDSKELLGDFFVRCLRYWDRQLTGTENFIDGLVNWKIMDRLANVDSYQTFLKSPLSLRHVRSTLENDYNIAFRFGDFSSSQPQILFYSDSLENLKESLNKIASDLTNPNTRDKLYNELILTPSKMPLDERIAYFEEQMRREIEAERNS